jgi:uncharacterized protein (TIGR02246 family)
MEQTPQQVAADYAARWERAWNAHGPAAAATLYAPDSVLVGAAVCSGREQIAQALAFIFEQGWREISIKVVNARAVGGQVLLVSEFSVRGSGPTAGKVLSGKSSHVLTRVADTWLSAMHTAVNGAPR